MSSKSFLLDTAVGPLVADLYLPQDFSAEPVSDPPPVVVVTGAWTTVKEQMATNYAKALAEHGYGALVFDFRGWGESKATVPNAVPFLEDPARKTVDIKAVISALPFLQDVDSSRVGVVGVCGSAGYALDAAMGNKAVKAVTVVAPWLHNSELVDTLYGGHDHVLSLIAEAEQAEKAPRPVIVPAASMTDEHAAMFNVPYYTESDRGLIDAFDNAFNVASWKPWLTYDALVHAPEQDKPVLMVCSEAMALPTGAHRYLDESKANVRGLWLDNITQFEFYDTPEVVKRATDEIANHFANYL